MESLLHQGNPVQGGLLARDAENPQPGWATDGSHQTQPHGAGHGAGGTPMTTACYGCTWSKPLILQPCGACSAHSRTLGRRMLTIEDLGGDLLGEAAAVIEVEGSF